MLNLVPYHKLRYGNYYVIYTQLILTLSHPPQTHIIVGRKHRCDAKNSHTCSVRWEFLLSKVEINSLSMHSNYKTFFWAKLTFILGHINEYLHRI